MKLRRLHTPILLRAATLAWLACVGAAEYATAQVTTEIPRPDRPRHPNDPTRNGPIDILTFEGTYVGTISAGNLPGLPAAFGPNGTVAFLTTGEYDVPVALVHRLPAQLG